MKWILCALGFMVIFVSCDTPYTGFLKAGDIDKYVERTGKETVCLADGFDSICIRTIPGLPGKHGKDGRDGKDGESIIGPRGERGPQGDPGRNGAVVYLELEKIVTEIETVEVPVIEKEIFVLHVSRTETTYITPIGAVYVPENAPVVAPSDVRITPVQSSPGQGASNPPTPPGLTEPALPDGGEIWHVMYRVENGQATVFVYPRAVLDPFTSNLPPNHVSGDTHGIDVETVSDVGRDYHNEIQGTQEAVNDILEKALEEENATLGTVGGVHGVVN